MTPTAVAPKALAFDAAYYPHLMDMIISAASLPTLLTLRQTSHTLKTSVEAHLTRRGCHMVLSPDGTEFGITFAVRDGPSFVVAKRETAYVLARYTHLLDVHGRTQPRTVLEAASRVRFGALKMTRVPNVGAVGAIYNLEGATFVVSVKCFWLSGDALIVDDMLHYRHPYPRDTSKVVINLEVDCHADTALNGAHTRLFEGTYVKDFVIIFTPTRSRYPTQPPAEEVLFDLFETIYEAVLMSVYSRFPVQYTLVDVGVLENPTITSQSNPELSHDRIREKITHDIQSLSQAHHITSRGFDRATLRFLRLHEYRAEVGDDIFALETLAPQTMALRNSRRRTGGSASSRSVHSPDAID